MAVRTHDVRLQRVTRLARPLAVRALVGEIADVGFNVSLDIVSNFAGVVALCALPESLPLHRVVGGDEELRDLLLQPARVLRVELGGGEVGAGDGDGGGLARVHQALLHPTRHPSSGNQRGQSA